MNSPGEPISPSPSTPSSSSPPNEEVNFTGAAPDKGGFLASVSSTLSTFTGGGGSSSKRRLPGGERSFGASASARDMKSRRRENSGRALTGGPQGDWDVKPQGHGGGKREKDDLLDVGLVEYLRKEIGDPFQEPNA